MNIDTNKSNQVKVVDSLMGTGKTTWAFNYMNMNNAPDRNFIYITPYLDEIERVKDACSELRFCDPHQTGKGKLHNLNKLLSQNRNIASTHALFKMVSTETRQLLSNGNYTLILDEVMDVLDEIEITQDDMDTLTNEDLIYIKDNFILWNQNKIDYDGTFVRYKTKSNNLVLDLKELCLNKSLMVYSGTILMWNFPTSIFECFEEVYVLTYLFNGQIQKYYFDLHEIDYDYYYIEEGNLINGYKKDYSKIKENLRNKITIIDGKINSIGNGEFALSKTWHDKQMQDKMLLNIMKKNLINYFKNITKSRSDDNMWTTFKNQKGILGGKGYSKGFVSLNERATNKYANKKYLAYTINRFIQTIVLKFFGIYDIKVDQDLYAVSELVQWVWRSQIRNNKPITIYIPSERMRNLLIDWLNNENL